MSDFQLDVIAWIICGLAFVFMALPCIGSVISGNKFTTYKEDIKIGAAIFLGLSLFSVVIFSLTWAFVRVF